MNLYIYEYQYGISPGVFAAMLGRYGVCKPLFSAYGVLDSCILAFLQTAKWWGIGAIGVAIDIA